MSYLCEECGEEMEAAWDGICYHCIVGDTESESDDIYEEDTDE